MISVLVIMLGSAAALVTRQLHETVNQEQEEKAFHVSEGGVYYVLFLLSSNSHTMQSLLAQSEPIEKVINDPLTGQEVGTATLTFSQPGGYGPGEGIQVRAVGHDSQDRTCQQIDAIIGANPYVVRFWDHPRQCAEQSLNQPPTPTPL
ncbi:MAG: hypothetical protein WD200_00015 [Candidatus Andersenbacteria bacterium]